MLPALLLFASVAAAKAVHSLSGIPAGWSLARKANPTDVLALKIGLHQRAADELERVVMEVSTPGHPNYGMHLSRNELRAFTAPSDEAVRAVTAWLEQHDIRTVAIDNDWVSFTTTVARANALLDTRFDWYQQEHSKTPVLRTLAYSVPDDLLDHVDLVQPTTRFGQMNMQRSTIFRTEYLDGPHKVNLAAGAGDVDPAAAASSCSQSITPDCIKQLYKINYTVDKPAKNLVGFASYLEEYARYSDLASFTRQYVPAAKRQNFSVSLINKGKNDQNSDSDSGEANLDVQYILGVSHPIPIVEYSTGGRGPYVETPDEPPPGSNEPYLEFLTYVLGLKDSELPQTLSTSYGEEEQSVPPEYALKICNMFMQLGGRGVSVLFSSGDSGPGDSCVRTSDDKPYFQPSFPAGCPYVTAVGATGYSSYESASTFSSGGFSTLHARPSWQEEAVGTYLEKIGDTYADFYNASNRGFPDVAAVGEKFIVIDKGSTTRLEGTSASSPVFTGVVALLNAARRSQGQAPLGFLNPWLYNQTASFNDVTHGAGIGCNNEKYFASPASWNATKGWDPVTGLGTPNFPALLAAAAPGVANQ